MRLGFTKTIGVLCAGLAVAMACSSETETARTGTSAEGFTLYLVRHAEKQAGDDPDLNAEGRARAEALADELEDAGLDTIWSTDYRRTRATAAPLAQRLRVEVRIYDPSDLEAFAKELEAAGETALVIGHSNTTPDLAALLGGEAGEPIDETSEYDRLYRLTGVGTSAAESRIERFGARYDPSEE